GPHSSRGRSRPLPLRDCGLSVQRGGRRFECGFRRGCGPVGGAGRVEQPQRSPARPGYRPGNRNGLAEGAGIANSKAGGPVKLIRRLLGIVVVLAVVAGLGFWLRPVSYFTELMYVRAT